MHGGRLAEHFGRVAHAFFRDFFALAFFNGAANQFNRFGQVKGLGQVFKRAALKGRDGAVQVGESRHDDDRQAGQFFLDAFEQVQARAARHADVAHQDLRAVFVGGYGQCGQYFARVGEAAGGQAFAQQSFFQNEPDGLVIVNEPNRFHAALSLVYHSNGGDRDQGRGIRILKSVRPGTLSHSIKPWCCCTKVCANVSPSPEPPSRPDTRG